MIAIAKTGTFQNQDRPRSGEFREKNRTADHDGKAEILERQEKQFV